MFEISFTDRALKQFYKLPKDIQERINSALERIKVRPIAYVTKLVGDPGYKLRVGDYRVVMEIEWGKLTILVIKVGHRKNIYK